MGADLPVTHGFENKPTVVNNVETLCAVAPILVHGADWYQGLGLGEHAGTKVISLSGDVARPGNYEVPIGLPLRTLIDDWEHTDSPRTEAGRWMYDAAYRWYDERYWNIILTPNYNAAHDDHFHVDLTPGGDYVGVTDGRFIGPAPYVD